MTLTAIRDWAFDFDPRALPGVRADPEAAAEMLGMARLPATIEVPVWCALVAGRDGAGLIDTGAGALLAPGAAALQAALAAAGKGPGDIRRIWLTHLHGDHCGGLIAPDGTAAFPHARIALSEIEADHWRRRNDEIGRDAARALAPYVDRIDLVRPGDLVEGAEALAAPGHTPGHTAWLLKDERTLAAGDILHVAALQVPRPDWSTDWDDDPRTATTSRRTILERARADGLTLLAAHAGPLSPADLLPGKPRWL